MLAAALAFLIGLMIGSFLNVCVYRWPRDLSVVRPRSYCPKCEHQIAWYENIPLLSYVLLKGRCRHCAAWISPRYPLVELITGGLFFILVLAYGPTPAAVKWCIFTALLVGLIFSDLEERILPDEMTIGGAAAGILAAAFVPFDDGFAVLFIPPGWGTSVASIIEAVFGAVVSSGLLWMIGTLYLKIRRREGLGLGDVKMVAMIGAFLGLQGALMTVVLGSILGSVLGLLFIIATRKKASTYELPFGTFLGAAALVLALSRDTVLASFRHLLG